MPEKPRKRIWVQHVAVDADVLQSRLEAAAARGLDPSQQVLEHWVAHHIGNARNAAFRKDPIPGRWANWWRGTLVEAAYRNLHAARAQMVALYDHAELEAEVSTAVARAQSTMHREDPRQISVEELRALPVPQRRARMRRLVEDGYESLDNQHAQLRSFRNILMLSALVISALVAATILVVSQRPSVMPLCFQRDATSVSAGQSGTGNATGNGTSAAPAAAQSRSCPTRAATSGPSGGDILVVALLGLLGGALAASVSIRGLRGTSTPYDVPVALAMLKVPLGAFTAILALVAIQGGFVPGLTALDSQEQILAYALVFGFAQQVFTRVLDRQAQTLLDGLPAKDAGTPPPRALPPGTGASGVPLPADDGGDEEADDGADEDEPDEPETQPNPEGDDEEQVQDDESDVLPDAPETDHR